MAQDIKRTGGDSSQTAVSGGRRQVAASFIPFETPQIWRPDALAGESLEKASATEYLGGGTDLVVKLPEAAEIAYGMYRLSPLLEPIVSALTANVYGAGYSLELMIDPKRPESFDKIKGFLAFEKSGGDFEANVVVTDEEVNAELDRIQRRIVNEKAFLDVFFSNCCPDMTFSRLCVLTGQDQEILGPGYWEVTRNGDTGKPERLIWAPAWTIRAMPLSEVLFSVEEQMKVSPIKWGPGRQMRRFRSFVQVSKDNQIVARYKEFGDPRCMSRKTGKFYTDISEMAQNLDEEYYTYRDVETGSERQVLAQPATELLSFSLPSAASSTYGAPLWSGVYPALLGTRDLDEENMRIVTDDKIPQMMMLISGGRGIPAEDIERFKQEISNKKPGERGLYILQAISQAIAGVGPSSDPKIHLERTKSEQHEDALGLNYKADAYAEVRRAYRMPKVSLGDEEGVNRSSALAMMRYTEVQVYDPKRDLFDDRINSTLLKDLDIQCVRYRTRSRVPKEPEELANIILTLVRAGGLTPDEVRELAGDIFNKEFKDLAGTWSKLPTPLLTALLQTKNDLIAAAVLGDESNQPDLLESLQEAYEGQISSGNRSSGDDDDDGDDEKTAGLDDEGSEGS